MYEIKTEQLDDHSCWTFDCPKCGADHRVGIEVLRGQEFMCSECGEWMLLKSNINLTASAPELLEALKELKKQIFAHHKMNVKKDYSLLVADAAASKAIAKAEGKAIMTQGES